MVDLDFNSDSMPAMIGWAPVGPPTTAQPGEKAAGTGAGGGAAPVGTGLGNMMPLIIMMIVVMLVMTMFGSRREKKRREQLMNSIKKHDRVQTNGGIIGAIVEIKPDTVVLKVDESSNTRITFSRSAIQQVLTSARSKDSGGDSAEPDFKIDEDSNGEA